MMLRATPLSLCQTIHVLPRVPGLSGRRAKWVTLAAGVAFLRLPKTAQECRSLSLGVARAGARGAAGNLAASPRRL